MNYYFHSMQTNLSAFVSSQRFRKWVIQFQFLMMSFGEQCKVYPKENASFPPEYNRPVVIYIVCCRGESRCTFIYFMCHLQLSVDGQGSGRGLSGAAGRGGGRRTTMPSHYKTVRSSANYVMVFVIEARRTNCDDHRRPTTDDRRGSLFIRDALDHFINRFPFTIEKCWKHQRNSNMKLVFETENAFYVTFLVLYGSFQRHYY